jgi:hypothetical protein
MVGRRQMFCKMTNRESLEKIRGWSLDHATFAMDDVDLGSPCSSSVLSSASGSCDGDAFDILQQAIQHVPCLDTREALTPVVSLLNSINANLLKLMSHFGVAPVQRSRLHLMITESSASDFYKMQLQGNPSHASLTVFGAHHRSSVTMERSA